MSDLSLVTTQDGSHTLRSKRFDATYHSIFGAVDESIHVFVMAGLDYYRVNQPSVQQLNVLEIGMGTGLNVWLTALWANKHQIKINMDTIEKYPITQDQYQQLNFHQSLPSSTPEQEILVQTIHTSAWDSQVDLTSTFSLTKYQTDMLSHEYPLGKYDVIFFDAFAPNAQPELWEEVFHQRLKDSLKPQAILTTYCAKGVFKRMLKGIGYELDQLPGPHRKHEMTRAVNIV